jgi:hypothetical protein
MGCLVELSRTQGLDLMNEHACCSLLLAFPSVENMNGEYALREPAENWKLLLVLQVVVALRLVDEVGPNIGNWFQG